MKYYVYILKSKKDNSLYVGLTTNIDKRFELHNNAKSNYTKGHLPYELKFNCEFPNKYIAAKFEKYLKSASGRAFTNKRLLE